ncbi:MAG TPA: response regulator transcription factor [Bacteroidales bacterium]|jgi:DNA-binding response OmpR family regulator|nr:response regulator transcription factor [Bacteroidales bacterium]OQB59702.1 MAG: Transcriptional regulatory protein CusR [Bacteroidetes bacterium ADurb.Bin145]HOU02320.1 response regulator transcription factor [Bacteroidales bacterium]HQG63415.1 response regulator transcription factor [Bacteroidales bacterium]HQK68325.1 response regulator transcription factor [Bacteroidales bacterium]
MHKILIVEDEPKVASFIKKGLEENYYEADVAYDGIMAEKMAEQNNYHLYILDIIIPHLNGLELCKRLKRSRPSVPVILLTALGTTEDKLEGFDSGADDYLVKPFEFRELLARIKVLLKRSDLDLDTVARLVVEDLELDLNKKIAIRQGVVIKLTAKEFLLLQYFMRNKNRVLSRNDIAEKVWDINYETDTNVVDVYVNFLRKKIDKNFDKKLIHTRIGLGYSFGET